MKIEQVEVIGYNIASARAKIEEEHKVKRYISHTKKYYSIDEDTDLPRFKFKVKFELQKPTGKCENCYRDIYGIPSWVNSQKVCQKCFGNLQADVKSKFRSGNKNKKRFKI